MKIGALGCALALFVLSGCESSVTGFLSCGVDVCSAREQCVDTPNGPACICAEGFEGSACNQCASGYERSSANQCTLIPIDCDENPEVCGVHGSCREQSPGDACECDELYTGRLCELCQPGYQDNDSDGVCRATCATAELACKAPSRCSDARGSAVCECPEGYTGDDCSHCALGYRDTGRACVATCAASSLQCSKGQVCVDGAQGARCQCAEGRAGAGCAACAEGYREDPSTGVCLPSCAGSDVSCGEHGRCEDSVGFAHCVCDLGYGGDSCATCADGFTAVDEGACRHELHGSETLAILGRYHSRSVLAALDPHTGETAPLLELSSTGLTAGGDPATLLFNDAGALTRLLLPSGERQALVPSSGAGGPLAWDAALGRVYAVGSKAPYPVLSIDPSSKTIVELFDAGLAGISDLAYDAAGSRLLALRDALYALSLEDGAVTRLGPLPPATLGIEVTAEGELLALAATDADEATSRVQACRASAARLELPGYAGATGRFVQPAAAADSVRLEAAGDQGREVLAYLGRGGDAPLRSLELAVHNPDAVVCLVLEEPTLVHVAQSAQFGQLLIYSPDSDVELALESDEAAQANIALGGYAASFTYPEREDVVAYTPQEWLALRLPIDPRFYQPGPGVLHTLDADLVVQSSITLKGATIPTGPLSSWEPPAL